MHQPWGSRNGFKRVGGKVLFFFLLGTMIIGSPFRVLQGSKKKDSP